ncbi:penicillin-insensitive murein endopeptidase [Crossiella sp. SN42]|uniref:penicillin-insensitive murein endopeptidase n=1 Tax=Crossiella sp. SN42 TaxID=2944808 RepID=UPI00207D4093|nr:penicillin-insensitive murein endopeptidase [Crossiella sp. SN42]MCO1577741.1 penicillin-insensitive murein endopeptidase [Crossiella sp. SN42]
MFARVLGRAALALLVTTLALVSTAAPAAALPGAFLPALGAGNRGADVLALQQLLRQHGQSPPADGVYAASTTTAVRAFQQAKGLAVDGIAGPVTWGALLVTLRQGATGPAVSALQAQLNAKRRLSLPVSGSFDAATRSAVLAFQQHAGLGADGVAGPDTWRNLLWHYDYPDLAALCDQDPDGNGTANWGTGATIGQLEAAARSFAGTGQGKVPLGDVSKEHGGDIAGHASHEAGMDVDLWPIRADRAQCTAGRITWRDPAYDRAATRTLVRALRSTAAGRVKLIFFNDPELIREGLTTRYDNHDNHLHIRYCAPVHPNPLYAC